MSEGKEVKSADLIAARISAKLPPEMKIPFPHPEYGNNMVAYKLRYNYGNQVVSSPWQAMFVENKETMIYDAKKRPTAHIMSATTVLDVKKHIIRCHRKEIQAIIASGNFSGGKFDLVINDVVTGEEYKDDETLIPKLTALSIRLRPYYTSMSDSILEPHESCVERRAKHLSLA